MMNSHVTVPRRRFLALAATLIGAVACGPASSTSGSGPSGAEPPSAAPGPQSTASAPAVAASPSTVLPGVAPSASASAQTGGAPEISQLNVSYDSPTAPSTFVLIAIDQKLPERYGVTLSATNVVATNSIAGLLSGDLQLALGGATAPIEAAVAGAPLRFLATFDDLNDYAIFAGPAISQPSDLQGKKIAIFGIADNTDISLHAALQPYGLVVNQDVTEVLVGNDAQRLAAVLSGNADAALLDQSAFGQQAQAQGLHPVISLMDNKVPWAGSTPITTAGFIQQNPKTVMAVMKGLIDAIRFLQNPANRDACVSVFARNLNIAPTDPQAGAFYQSVLSVAGVFSPTGGVASILTALQQIDPQKYGAGNVTDLVDTSFLTQLASSGFVTLDT